MANWNKLTEKQFNAIKLLLNGGATQGEAAEYMQLSAGTVCLVNKAESFEEYLQIKTEQQLSNKRRVAAIKGQEKPQEKPQTPATQVMNPTVVRIEATHYMMQELQKTNELLTLISRKLGAIVDDLYGTGTKEG